VRAALRRSIGMGQRSSPVTRSRAAERQDIVAYILTLK